MKIVIIGGGSYGTALSNQLASNENNQIYLLIRDVKVEKEINQAQLNSKHFPKRALHHNLMASSNFEQVSRADVIMLAIPFKSMGGIIPILKKYLMPDTLVVNLAKGIVSRGETIVEHLRKSISSSNIITMKGAAFSAELIHGLPSLFTIGFDNKNQLDKMIAITENTSIYLDYTTDIKGVEMVSAFKNIYAIAIGFIDAQYDSVNTRFLILTKAVQEIRTLMRVLGGLEDTIFLSCGIGDIGLTGLSDLSQNRTLGLLIGKGFYSPNLTDNSDVMEGLNTLRLLDDLLPENIKEKLPLFTKVKDMMASPEEVTHNFDFKKLFRRNYKTVLTYGTFDLLHFGHLELLRRVREMGDKVIVGLSTDEFNKLKGKESVMPYEKRKHLLEVLSFVDLVIPEYNWEQKVNDIKNFQVDIFVMGDDWIGKFDFLEKHCQVKYLPRTKGVSTTKIKSILEE